MNFVMHKEMNSRLFFLLVLPLISSAQIHSLEDYLDPSESERAHPLEEFAEYIQNPLDINKTQHSQLAQFYFIPDHLIDSLLYYRPFKSLSKVKKILGHEFFQLIQPFIYLEKKTSSSVRISTQFSRKLDQWDPQFIGSMLSNKNTLRISVSDQLQAGFLTQKDAGERYLNDHWSCFLSWQNDIRRFCITVGDYYLYHGQGLIASSPYLMRKSTAVLAPFRKSKNDSRPLLSAQENQIFRGLYAGCAPFEWLYIDTFFSHTEHDITGLPVTTISTTGYHRTAQETRNRDILIINGLGSRLRFALKNLLKVSMCFIVARYNPHLNSLSDYSKRRDYFKFSGARSKNISLSVSGLFNPFLIAGEIALSNNKYKAYQVSAVIREKIAQFALRFWHISPSFHAPYSPYATEIRNTKGLYTAFAHRLHARLSLDSYLYIEKSIWRTYFNPLPVLQNEIMIRARYRFAPQTWLYLKYQRKYKEYYSSSENLMNILRQIQHRIDLEKKLFDVFRIKTRIEYIYVNDSGACERGFNMFQDIRWRFLKEIIIHFRLGSFYTDSYDSRVYEYESDLPSAFSSFPLSGAGSKWYVYIVWKCMEKVELHLKYRVLHQNENIQRDLGLYLLFKL